MLPDWLPKTIPLVLFSNLPRMLREKRQETKLIQVKRWIIAGERHLTYTLMPGCYYWKGILYGRILYDSLSKSECLFYLLSSLQGASFVFLHRQASVTETTKYHRYILVHITREYVDRQKQFNFSQVSFLNPQSLTFEKSLAMVKRSKHICHRAGGKKKK